MSVKSFIVQAPGGLSLCDTHPIFCGKASGLVVLFMGWARLRTFSQIGLRFAPELVEISTGRVKNLGYKRLKNSEKVEKFWKGLGR
jgi:hypothetical protein